MSTSEEVEMTEYEFYGLKTERKTAQVAVRNNTGRSLASVSIAHKYSDVIKNHHTWTNVASGQETGSGMKVDYNIGWFTTGKDWWHINVIDEAGQIYISYPHNFREIFDKLEKLAKSALEPLKEALEKAATKPGAGPKAAAAAAAGHLAATLLGFMLNEAETAGFKQHILRESDAGNTVRFTLRNLPVGVGEEAYNALEIKSPSGVSETYIKRIA